MGSRAGLCVGGWGGCCAEHADPQSAHGSLALLLDGPRRQQRRSGSEIGAPRSIKLELLSPFAATASPKKEPALTLIGLRTVLAVTQIVSRCGRINHSAPPTPFLRSAKKILACRSPSLLHRALRPQHRPHPARKAQKYPRSPRAICFVALVIFESVVLLISLKAAAFGPTGLRS